MRRTQVSPRRLDWLQQQLDAWRADGLVGDDQARAIRDRYEPGTSAPLMTLVVYLGMAFLGVGVLWLVAANYEELSPVARFGIVAALWLGTTVAGVTVERVAAPLRLLAALLFGAVVFQAAQSLQVPAYEPSLLLAWAGGALALAYAERAVAPLVVGISAGLGWYLWLLLDDPESAAPVVLGLALATPVLVAVAVAHRGGPMGGPWRDIGCFTGLAALFVAAFPGAVAEYDGFSRPVYAGLAAALVAIVAAGLRAGRAGAPELAGAAGVAVAALVLVAVAPDASFFSSDRLSGATLGYALAGSAVFLAAAVGVAAAGVAREAPGLVNLAAAALVLFVTFQSFGVFAPLLSGAGLFLLVGTVLVVGALLVDRGRRRLREEIEA